MDARELERLMERTFGPGWRDKVLVSPTGAFRLGDAFEECGLRDPSARPEGRSYGLWQPFR